MNDLITIFLNTVTTKNIILCCLLGIIPLLLYQLTLSKTLNTGLIILAIMIITRWLTLALENLVLLPFGLLYLKIPLYIITIYFAIYSAKIFSSKYLPTLSNLFDNYPEFFYTNYAIYGISFFNDSYNLKFLPATVFVFGSGAGYLLVMVIFMAIKERIAFETKLTPAKKIFLEMILLGFLSLLFFTLIVKR